MIMKINGSLKLMVQLGRIILCLALIKPRQSLLNLEKLLTSLILDGNKFHKDTELNKNDNLYRFILGNGSLRRVVSRTVWDREKIRSGRI